MNIVLIGHTVGIEKCILAIRDSEHSIKAIFTHPKDDHRPDLETFEKRASLFGDYAYDVFDTHEKHGIPVFEYQNLTDQREIDKIKEFEPDLIATVGCRDILRSNFIESFPYVINLHPYNLPFLRGAGIDSWMILQGLSGTTQQATCHYINPRIDAGNVIARHPYSIPAQATPLEILKIRIDTLGKLLVEAIRCLEDSGFVGEPQNEDDSRYFPRLNTQRDGQLDFTNWSGQEIDLFVRAFSYPYDGAWFMLGDRKIHSLKCEFVQEENVHPFSYGLVFKKEDDALRIFCAGGYVRLSNLEENNARLELKTVKLGKYVNQ